MCGMRKIKYSSQTCVGVGVFSGHIIINHLMWIWKDTCTVFTHHVTDPVTRQPGCDAGRELEDRQTQGCASSNERGRKSPGIQLCHKNILKRWEHPAGMSWLRRSKRREMTPQQHCGNFDLTRNCFLTFHPCGVGRICCPFCQSILFSDRWILFTENTWRTHKNTFSM